MEIWASLGDGEAHGIRIGTWAKVEMEKLLKLSISGVKDNFPGLLLDLKKKKKKKISHLKRDSEFCHLQARGLWNYKVTRTTIKPVSGTDKTTPSQGLFLMMTSCVYSGSHSVWKTSELKYLKAIWNLGYTFLLNSSSPVFGFVFKVVGPANSAPEAPEKSVKFSRLQLLSWPICLITWPSTHCILIVNVVSRDVRLKVGNFL